MLANFAAMLIVMVAMIVYLVMIGIMGMFVPSIMMIPVPTSVLYFARG